MQCEFIENIGKIYEVCSSLKVNSTEARESKTTTMLKSIFIFGIITYIYILYRLFMLCGNECFMCFVFAHQCMLV